MICTSFAKYQVCYISYIDKDANYCVSPYNKHLKPVRNYNCQKQYDRTAFTNKQM